MYICMWMCIYYVLKTLEALDAPFSMSVNMIQSGTYVCTYVNMCYTYACIYGVLKTMWIYICKCICIYLDFYINNQQST
jgi:hypothetical protein